MASRLRCENCGAGLVPAVYSLRCPRLTACGRGGRDETAYSLRPSFMDALPETQLVRA